jgi:branched-subunit amino acid permease
LMLVSILLSGLCALGASVPWVLGARNPRLVQIVEPYRQLLFGTAAALLMGLVVGVALG